MQLMVENLLVDLNMHIVVCLNVDEVFPVLTLSGGGEQPFEE